MNFKSDIEFFSETAKTVSIAGTFNKWCNSEIGPVDPSLGLMKNTKQGVWSFSVSELPPGKYQYKFIIDGKWQKGLNQTFHVDEKGHLFDPSGGIEKVSLESYETIKVKFLKPTQQINKLTAENFTLSPTGQITKVLHFESSSNAIELLCSRINIDEPIELTITGLKEYKVQMPVILEGIFRNNFISDKPLGLIFDKTTNNITFRLFSPRASSVKLLIFSDPQGKTLKYESQGWKDKHGVWEMKAPGTWWNNFYGFKVSGSQHSDEGFKPEVIWPDPYAKANNFHNGLSIILNNELNSDGFNGWTDQNFSPPKKQNLIIYEASIRDLTSHSSSDIPDPLKGKYTGLMSTVGKNSGIAHMKDLGINAIEFLPVFEYDDNPPGTYHWGYMPSLMFAPEASYAINSLGGQINEFKTLINTLHNNGLAVILDVVYNHTGSPHILMGIDKQYYYRHNGEMALLNYSGCGNDLKTENPMVRRMILDSLKYWIKEFHIDGFRFDLAELIDLQTLTTIEKELTAINPDIVLITEPWSSRGSLKGELKGTSWAHWNNNFKDCIKNVVLGKTTADKVIPFLTCKKQEWLEHPLESVNYVESHDKHTLADSLSSNTIKNGNNPSDKEIRQNLLCAAMTLLAPGIPMIAAGQEMLRSKKGDQNSYRSGDNINAIDYRRKKQYLFAYKFYQGLIELRQSPHLKIIRSATLKDCQNVKTFYVPQNGIAIFWHDQLKPLNSLLLMFNTSPNRATTFELSLISGKWKRLVGECKVTTTNSINNREMYISHREKDQVELTLSPLGIEVWAPIE